MLKTQDLTKNLHDKLTVLKNKQKELYQNCLNSATVDDALVEFSKVEEITKEIEKLDKLYAAVWKIGKDFDEEKRPIGLT